jgi:hypothetical protein
MKPIASRLIRLAVVSPLIMMGTGHNGGCVAAAQQHSPATVTRIYTGSDGLAHAEQIDVTFTALYCPRTDGDCVGAGEGRHLLLCELPSWFVYGIGTLPRRVGVWLHSVAGQRLRWRADKKIALEHRHILRVEDVTGKGRTLRILGKVDWIALLFSSIISRKDARIPRRSSDEHAMDFR